MVEINSLCNPGWVTLSFLSFLTSLTSKFLNSRSSQFSYFSKFIQTFHVQTPGGWIRRRRRQRRAASWSRTRSWVWSPAGWGTSVLISTQKMISTKIFLSTTSNWTTLHQYYELTDNSCWFCYKTLQLKDWNHSPDRQDLTESKSKSNELDINFTYHSYKQERPITSWHKLLNVENYTTLSCLLTDEINLLDWRCFTYNLNTTTWNDAPNWHLHERLLELSKLTRLSNMTYSRQKFEKSKDARQKYPNKETNTHTSG